LAATLTANSPIQFDSGTGNIFGCWPRHQVRILVPERGEPTTKIGLFTSCISSIESLYLTCSPYPEATAAPTRQSWEGNFKFLLVVVIEVAVGHLHFELRIKGEKRMQQILLTPKPKLLHYPITPVIKRQKDIVDAHDDSWFETWQNFQK